MPILLTGSCYVAHILTWFPYQGMMTKSGADVSFTAEFGNAHGACEIQIRHALTLGVFKGKEVEHMCTQPQRYIEGL